MPTRPRAFKLVTSGRWWEQIGELAVAPRRPRGLAHQGRPATSDVTPLVCGGRRIRRQEEHRHALLSLSTAFLEKGEPF
jgi:hypothetical protein